MFDSIQALFCLFGLGETKVRAVTRIVSNNEYTYELYMTGPDGKEFKSLEFRSVRKK